MQLALVTKLCQIALAANAFCLIITSSHDVNLQNHPASLNLALYSFDFQNVFSSATNTQWILHCFSQTLRKCSTENKNKYKSTMSSQILGLRNTRTLHYLHNKEGTKREFVSKQLNIKKTPALIRMINNQHLDVRLLQKLQNI